MKTTADRFFHRCLIVASVLFVVPAALESIGGQMMSLGVLGAGLIVVVVNYCRERNRTIKENIAFDRDLTMLLIRARGAEFGYYICPVCESFNDNKASGLPENYCDSCNRLTHEPPAPIER